MSSNFTPDKISLGPATKQAIQDIDQLGVVLLTAVQEAELMTIDQASSELFSIVKNHHEPFLEMARLLKDESEFRADGEIKSLALLLVADVARYAVRVGAKVADNAAGEEE